MNCNSLTFFYIFRIEYILQEIKKLIDNKVIKANTYRIQSYDSIMHGYFRIGFIDFMLKNKILADFTNLFLPKNFRKNDNVILNCLL